MNKELYVSSTPHETRLALVEDGETAEVYIEREKEFSLAGAIFKGRVTRVLPGMQSAFVDIGLERDAFLYVSDFFEDSDEYERVVSEAESAVDRLEGRAPARVEGAAPAEVAELPVAAPPEAAASPASAETVVPVPAREPQGDAQGGDHRRHRRGRHRRRGRQGIPESKFARLDAAAGEPASGAAAAETRPESDDEEPEPQAAPAPAEVAAVPAAEAQAPVGPARAPAANAPRARAYAPMVLPGESLAKYRNRAPEPAAQPEPPVRTEPPVQAKAPVQETNAGEETGVERVEAEQERAQPDSPLSVPELEPQSAAPAHSEGSIPARPQGGGLPPWDEHIAAGADEPEAGGEAGDEAGDVQASALAAALELDIEAAGEDDAVEDLDAADVAEAASDGAAGDGEPMPANASAAQSGPAAIVPLQARQGRGRRRRRHGQGAPAGPSRPLPGEPVEEERGPRRGATNGSPRLIGELLHPGQEILVQVSKEPLGRKGARITSHLALPGRFLVYMPTVRHIGVSRKIGSDEERARVKRIILENTQDLPGGFIVRTAGAGATDEEFKADIRLLANLWNEIRAQFEKARAPATLHHDLNLVERTLRDQLSEEFTHIWVDSDEQYQRIVKFISYFMPPLVDRVRLYTRDVPMFEHYGIQEEIDKALKSKVWLKSGGYIVVNQTEALVAIDVNTGKFVGKSNRLEDTIVKTNVDAIKEIVRQIRLRDLGGIIVIDFIDMDERRNRQRVMQALEEAMRADRAPSKVLSFNDFGLVALTRKRVKQSLERTLGCACPYCDGVGLVKSPTTVCNEIYTEVRKVAASIERDDLVLRVNPEIGRALKAQGAARLKEMEEATGKALSVRSDPQVHQEQFEIY